MRRRDAQQAADLSIAAAGCAGKRWPTVGQLFVRSFGARGAHLRRPCARRGVEMEQRHRNHQSAIPLSRRHGRAGWGQPSPLRPASAWDCSARTGRANPTLLLHLNGILPEKPDGGGAVKIMGESCQQNRILKKSGAKLACFSRSRRPVVFPLAAEDVAFGPQQLGLSEAEIAGPRAQRPGTGGSGGICRRATHHLSHGEKRRLCLAACWRATRNSGAGRTDQ